MLRKQETEVGKPAAGELQVRHTAVGLNDIAIYHRNGLYRLLSPTGLGVEGGRTSGSALQVS